MATTKQDRGSTPITFLVPSSGGEPGMRATTRADAAPPQPQEAIPGMHVVELVVASPDGEEITLVLAPESARDLLLSQAGQDGAGKRAMRGAADGDAVVVPRFARWDDGSAEDADGTSRSLFPGDPAGVLTFRALQVLGPNAVAGTANALRDLIDSGVKEGVYRLQREELGSLRDARTAQLEDTAEAQLVLVHGTFSDTAGTFGGWWKEHPALVRRIFEDYGDRVFALDHRTLGRSPIDNALTLAAALPDGAVIDLVTHSRGGLVADVLARAAAGLSPQDDAFFDSATHATQKAQLRKLANNLRERRIQVRRVVRVACPLHGTHLASGRLDAYFSVLRFLLERAGVPLLPHAVEFLREVARRRADPQDFPGLEAMLPDGPVARWLGSARELPGQLRVVAGDTDPGLLDHWLRGLLAIAVVPLFMQDNDLVVHTASMYGGATRTGGLQFRLLRGGEVDHLHYFKHDDSANAIAEALLDDEPAGFLPIGPLSQAGQSSSGTRAARRPDPALPAVIVVPGIMGSHLRSAEGREWLVSWRLPGVVGRIAMDQPLTPDGPVDDTYAALCDYLARRHQVVEFSYDWRAPIETSAQRLADTIRAELDRRGPNGPPVRILAHSMGGLVTRAVMAHHVDVWRDMLAHADARVIMLGTPNHGSWAPMQSLTGDDKLTRLLASVGGWMRDLWARERFAEFTGLLQMQAGLEDPDLRLRSAARWKELAAQDKAHAHGQTAWHDSGDVERFYEWALPAQPTLDSAVRFWRKLRDADGELQAAAPKMAVVLGRAPATPCGLAIDRGVDYEFTSEGDGRVPWSSTCLPGVATWIADAVHGDLPEDARNFRALEDLLLHGDTQALPRHVQAARGTRAGTLAAAGTWRGRPRDEALGAAPPASAIARAAAGAEVPGLRKARRGPVRPLAVSVVHGDVRFTPHVLMVGHYSALELTGSEWVVDQLLGGAMSDSLRAGLYPDRPGDHQVFRNRRAARDNPWSLPRPSAVVVVGLGADGDLTAKDLRTTVRRGVLALLQQEAQERAGRNDGAPGDVTLALTSLGSGGNLTVSESVQQAVQGVLEANDAAGQLPAGQGWPRVGAMEVVELYGDRAAEAWHGLRLAASVAQIKVSPGVTLGTDARSQPPQLGYRGTKDDLVRVRQLEEATGTRAEDAGTDPERTQAALRRDGAPTMRTLEYTLFTRRARSELRAKSTQVPLIEALVAQAEGDSRSDPGLARTLYQLLAPRELRSYLGGGSSLVLELDTRTAQYPWEMMDDEGAAAGDGRPLGLRMASVLRRLVVENPAPVLNDTAVDGIFVLGMSCVETWKGNKLDALPGVLAELDAVESVLGAYRPKVLRDPAFDDAIKPAVTEPWKVMHLSGHGVHDPDGRTGMILSDGVLLTAAELASRDHLPELVFINCCHLGKFHGQRGAFAANVADQLIRMGVRCVVAAGWAVDDAAACAFAGAFYEALLAGQNFAAAVSAARQRAWQLRPSSSTWAAYQCYGDGAWTLRPPSSMGRKVGGAREADTTPALATPQELLASLEQVEVDARHAPSGRTRKSLADKLRKFNQMGEPLPGWLRQGRVSEAMAKAWDALGDAGQAIAWYERALKAPDASASLQAQEQWLNLRARQKIDADESAEIILQLEEMAQRAPTGERLSLVGSAWKRRAMTVQEGELDLVALRQMELAYDMAHALDEPNAYYPALQGLLAQVRLAWAGEAPMPAASRFDEVRMLLDRAEHQRLQNFWTAVGQLEVEIYRRVALAKIEPGFDPAAGLQGIHGRVTHPKWWASVRDTARFVLDGVEGLDPPPAAVLRLMKKLLSQLDVYARPGDD